MGQVKKEMESSRTVGELVAEDFRRAGVFRKYGIDFCCGGKRSVENACRTKGVDIRELRTALREVEKQPQEAKTDYSAMEMDALAQHIIDVHHRYVNDALPLLDELSDKVARVHGEANPEVVDIRDRYNDVAAELRMHMHKEEVILFPWIMKMAQVRRSGEQLAPPPFGTIENPIRMMEAEHESAGDGMADIEKFSGNFTPPGHACTSYRVLFAKLQEFNADLQTHIHLENNILFPAASALENELLAR